MACIPATPILPEDPLAYFVPALPIAATPPALLRPVSALEQMFGYYNVDLAA